METMTHEELKQQIAEMEASEKQNDDLAGDIEAEDQNGPEQPDDIAEGTEGTLQEVSEDPGRETQQDDEIEPWLRNDDSAGPSVPLKALIKTRDKLKGKLHSRDSELQQLKAELEKLKTNKQVETTITKRPIIDDYTDIEEYNRDMDRYEESRLMAYQQSQEQQRKQLEVVNSIQSKVDAHYDEAQQLIDEYRKKNPNSGLTEESYNAADTAVVNALDAVFPGRGRVMTDAIISKIGKGSSKTMYAFGRNETLLRELQSAFISDPTGVDALVLLKEKNKELSQTPIKNKSNARPPATALNGNRGINMSTRNLKTQYEKALKSGDLQGAHNALKQARAAKADVSDW